MQHSMSSRPDKVWSRDHRDAHGENEWADVLDMGLGVPPYILVKSIHGLYYWDAQCERVIHSYTGI